MGTRNLTCVVKNGQYLVAQYGQFDGYPTGVGEDIVKFLTGSYDPARFAAQLDKLVVLTDDEVTARWRIFGADEKGLVTLTDAQHFAQVYPSLHRNMAGDILQYVQDTAKPEVHLRLAFAADSLFCEYAYVVNLDNNTLEVFTGFNEEPLTTTDRFFFLQEADATADNDYFPVRLYATIPFVELQPGVTMRALEERMNAEAESADDEEVADDAAAEMAQES